MSALPDLRNFDAGQMIDYGRAGQKQRTLADLGNFAAQGDFKGAEAVAWQGGETEIAQAMRSMAREEQERLMEDTARFAMGADNEAAWEAGRQQWLARGYELPPFAARQALINQAVPVVEQIRMQRDQANSDRDYALRASQANRPNWQTVKHGEMLFDPASGRSVTPTMPDGEPLAAPANFDDEAKLRGEYLKGSGDFMTVRDSYGRLQAASQDQTGASDIAMVYSFMKMLDPGSVVREGEFATAETAGGVPEQIVSLYNKVINGERLSPGVRQQFLDQGLRQFEAAQSRQNAYADTYGGLSNAYGFDRSRITPDLSAGVRAPIDPNAPTATGPNGQRMILQDGQWVPFDGR